MFRRRPSRNPTGTWRCATPSTRADLPGTLGDGTWATDIFTNLQDACGQAFAHEDGMAHVAVYLGSHLVAVQCN